MWPVIPAAPATILNTMNLLLLETGELTPLPAERFSARLDGRRAEHVFGVLKAQPGQELRVGVIAETGAESWPAGARGRGLVLSSRADLLELEIEFDRDPGDPGDANDANDAHPLADLPRVDLAIALPRPQGLHRILQAAAGMAVGRIDLFRSYRVEKSYFSSPSLKPGEIRRQLLLGAEQGRITRLPVVEIHARLRPFLDRPELLCAGELGLLAHPGTTPIEDLAPPPGGRQVLVIGPEGGFLDHEVEAFLARGFNAVDLGPWVLRSETAVTAALAQILLLARIRRKSAPGLAVPAC